MNTRIGAAELRTTPSRDRFPGLYGIYRPHFEPSDGGNVGALVRGDRLAAPFPVYVLEVPKGPYMRKARSPFPVCHRPGANGWAVRLRPGLMIRNLTNSLQLERVPRD